MPLRPSILSRLSWAAIGALVALPACTSGRADPGDHDVPGPPHNGGPEVAGIQPRLVLITLYLPVPSTRRMLTGAFVRLPRALIVIAPVAPL